MAKKIVVLPGCIACGLCTASEYMEEKPDGTVVAKGGAVLSEREEAAFQKVMEECPAKVLSLESVVSKSRNEVISKIDKEAESFVISVPPKSSIAFDERYIQIHAPGGVPGEYAYDYSSYNRAKDAAKQAIDRAFYSQRRTAVQNVINDYRIDKLSGYYDYKETANNFYYQANQTAQKLLENWIQEIRLCKPGVTISEELRTIQARPNLRRNYVVQGIESDLLQFADSILAELSDSVYSLSSYVDYCDIDSDEVYAGEGMFGISKYVTKYCFSNTSEAFREMEKDLRWACQSSFSEKVVDQAYSYVKVIAEGYSKALKEELKNKAGELKKLL